MSRTAKSPVPPAGAEFLTVAQTAHLLQVCTRTIRDYVKAGRLRRYGSGGLYRLRRAEIESYLKHASAPKQDEDEAAAISILRRMGG